MNWTDDKVTAVKELIISGETSWAISQILSERWNEEISKYTVDNIRSRFGMAHLLENATDVPFYREDTLPEDNYMISCDYHAPYYSEPWVNRMFAVAQKMGVKKHIIVGDLFDMDFAKWQQRNEGEAEPTIDQEQEWSSPLIKALDYFDKIYCIAGNHETRLGRITDAKIQFKHIVQYFTAPLGDKFKFSEYDKLRIGDDWLVIHPKSYSQVSGSVAVRLTEKFHRHVLNAHGHFIALRFDRSGKYMGVDLGGMFNQEKIAYSSLKTTTHPFWNCGFGMIYGGYFHHFHAGTDWSIWT